MCRDNNLLRDLREGKNEHGQSTALGSELINQRDRVYGTYRIILEKDHGHHGKLYRLVEVDSK